MMPEGGDRELLRRIAEQVRPFAPHVLCILLLDLLATPLALLAPLPLKIAVDSVLGDRPPPFPFTSLAPGSGTLLIAAAGLLVAIALSSQVQALGA
jgi:ATP-binding cassette subfamily B protein